MLECEKEWLQVKKFKTPYGGCVCNMNGKVYLVPTAEVERRKRRYAQQQEKKERLELALNADGVC